jgi:hypothetical protein
MKPFGEPDFWMEKTCGMIEETVITPAALTKTT